MGDKGLKNTGDKDFQSDGDQDYTAEQGGFIGKARSKFFPDYKACRADKERHDGDNQGTNDGHF